MSNIGAILAPAASIAAHGNQAATPRADASNAHNLANNSIATVGTAAVVSLRASSKERAASSGEKRQIDAAFDKERIKGGRKDSESSSASSKKSLNVVA